MNKANRIIEHPILGRWEDRPKIAFTFDGQRIEAYQGDTIASALLAQGIRTLRVHEESGSPRGIYCNIGHCYECRVTVNGVRGVRACLKEVEEDMVVESGRILPTPLKREKETQKLPRTYHQYEQLLGRQKEGKIHD